MKQFFNKSTLRQALTILAGSFIFGVSVSLFLTPSGIVTGGVSGIAILLHRAIPLGTGILFFLLNLPILIAGLVLFGCKFMISTVIATLLTSLFTDLSAWALASVIPVTQDMLLLSIIGGAFSGAGLGLILRAGSTTGGTDILVKIVRRRYRHFKPGALFFLFDSVIIVASAITFRRVEIGLYSAIALFFSSAMVDLVIYGRDKAVLAYIICEHEAELTDPLLKDMEVGATLLPAEGAYTAQPRKVILCAVKKQNLPRLQQFVQQEAPEAFMIVTSANEIYGEGFKRYNSDF